MRPSTDRMNGMQVRKPCGCYTNEGGCECDATLDIDPWLIAGEDVNLNRKAETRSYRQSKFRK